MTASTCEVSAALDQRSWHIDVAVGGGTSEMGDPLQSAKLLGGNCFHHMQYVRLTSLFRAIQRGLEGVVGRFRVAFIE